MTSFLTHLTSGRALLLDGATGTELDRRGVNTRLPLWSARALIEAPTVVRAIHADYINAGADHHDEYVSHTSPHAHACGPRSAYT